MKKYIVALILLLGGWQGLFGQSSPALGSFTTAAVAAGPSINLLNTGVVTHRLTWQTSGTVSTCTVALDTSADGVTWTPGGAIAGQTCTGNGLSSVVTTTVNYVRINVTTLSGGGSVIVTYNGWQVLDAQIVATASGTNMTASVPNTTIYTPATDGYYRYNIFVYMMVAGTAGTVQGVATYQPTTNGAYGDGTAAITTTNPQTHSTFVYATHIRGGTPIQYSVVMSGITGSPVYGYDIVIEKLN